MKLLSFTLSSTTCNGAIGHRDDCRRKMSDAEIITTAMVGALFFNGNQVLARAYLKEHGLIPQMLEKSPFCRRWNQLLLLLDDLFHQLGLVLKQLNGSTEYLLDSFPVPVCENIRSRIGEPAYLSRSNGLATLG